MRKIYISNGRTRAELNAWEIENFYRCPLEFTCRWNWTDKIMLAQFAWRNLPQLRWSNHFAKTPWLLHILLFVFFRGSFQVLGRLKTVLRYWQHLIDFLVLSRTASATSFWFSLSPSLIRPCEIKECSLNLYSWLCFFWK